MTECALVADEVDSVRLLGAVTEKRCGVTAASLTHEALEFQVAALNATAIVAVTDVKGVILEVNNKFCQISGYSRDELIGQDHRILKSGVHSTATADEVIE